MKKRAKTSAQLVDDRLVVSKDGVPLARVRRVPSLVAFLVTGFAIGAIAGLIVSVLTAGGNYTDASSMGYFAMLLGGLGALLGAVAYVIADGRQKNSR